LCPLQCAGVRGVLPADTEDVVQQIALVGGEIRRLVKAVRPVIELAVQIRVSGIVDLHSAIMA
jgi:hypothetical protein